MVLVGYQFIRFQIMQISKYKVYATGGRILHVSCQLVTILVFPIVLTPELYADFSLLLPLGMLGAAFVFGWVNGAGFRWIHKLVDMKHIGLRSTISVYYIFLSQLLLWLSLFLFFSFDNVYYYLVPLLVLAAGLKDCLIKLSNASESYSLYFRGYTVLFLSKLFFIFFVAYFDLVNLEMLVLAFIATEISYLLPFLKIAAKISSIVNFKLFRLKFLIVIFSYGMPMVLAAFSGWLISLSDRYILSFYLNKIELASYVLIYQLASNAFVVPLTFFMTIFFPALLRIEKDRGLEKALDLNNVYMKRYLAVLPLMVIIYYFMVSIFFKYIYADYDLNLTVLLIVLISQSIFMLSYFQSKLFEMNNKTLIFAIALLLGGFINIVSNFILIPGLGQVGAAVATLISSLSVVIMLKFLTFKYTA